MTSWFLTSQPMGICPLPTSVPSIFCSPVVFILLGTQFLLFAAFKAAPSISIIFSVSFVLPCDFQSFVISFTIICHGASQLWLTLLQLLFNSGSLWMLCRSPTGQAVSSTCHSSTHAIIPFLLGFRHSPSPTGFPWARPNGILAHGLTCFVFQMSFLHNSSTECESLTPASNEQCPLSAVQLHRHRKE